MPFVAMCCVEVSDGCDKIRRGYMSMLAATTAESIDECNLTPRLDKMCRALANVPDDKLR